MAAKFLVGLTSLALGAGMWMTGAATASAAEGSVSGTVFRDYNLNGVIDTEASAENPAVDVGVAGVAVTAYDAAGDEVGTATTAADGTYTLDYDTGDDSTDVRLEFAVPSGFSSTQSGVDGSTSGTSVQFVSAGDTADLGIHAPGDYSAGGNALIITPIQRGAIQTNGDPSPGQPTDPSLSALVSTPQTTQGSETPPLTAEATQAQIGSTFGTASLPSATSVNGYVFTSALVKRHSKLGPGGAGAIYLTNIDGDANGELFATIPNAGDPRPSNDDGGYDWFKDPEVSGEEVFTTGLGGLVAAGDGSALYVTNLNDGQIYRIPITTPLGTAPEAGDPVAIGSVTDLPGADQGCAADATRPFGLGIDGGTLYAGVTCTGPDTDALRSYVYSYDLETEEFSEAPVLETSLDFARGCGQAGDVCPAGSNMASVFDGGIPQSSAWNPWTDDPWTAGAGANRTHYPQGVLSDITVDRTGALSISFRDRTGDQVGWSAGSPAAGDTRSYGTHVSGDMLKACGNATDGWTLEDNGSCGGQAGAGAGNNRGPGGGEFYDGKFDNGTYSHDNTWMGGSGLVPGFSSIRSTVYDPTTTVFSGGVKRSSISDGSFSAGLKIYGRNGSGAVDNSSSVGTMGKGNGLGDLTTLAEQGPVEIGNRVWIDDNSNGIQDPGEAPVEGVQVEVECEGGATGSTTTDADGEYYFNDGNVDGGLPSTTECTLTFDAAGTDAEGYDLTEADQGDVDVRDSDGQAADEQATIAATTPAAGADHSYDVGYVPADEVCSLGDFVWRDSNSNGVQDDGEPGVEGVTVTLIDPETGEPVEGIDPVTTDGDGAYAFPEIPCGEYIVRFSDLPEGTSFTPPNEGDDDATDSDPTPTPEDPTVGETEPVTVGEDPGDPADNDDPTIDAGIVEEPPTEVCSLGDFVWNDQDGDGVQDEGEPGVPGVTVTLIDPETGEPVAGIDPVTTDENGNYTFPSIPCGEYIVEFSGIPNGSEFTPPNEGDDTTDSDPTPDPEDPTTGRTDPVTVGEDPDDPSDNEDPTVDAGIILPDQTCAVGDYVWLDDNKNGLQDEGEDPVAGVTVELRDTEGTVVDSTTTDDQGAYAFDLQACGDYTVRFSDVPDGYAFTEQETGDDRATDSNPDAEGVTPTFTLGEGEPNNAPSTEDDDYQADIVNPTIDAGLVKPEACSLGDYVWQDQDSDGVQDEGEPGVPNATVTLIDPETGEPVEGIDPVTTDDDGKYLFGSIPCGEYLVEFSDIPEGTEFTKPNSGDDAEDSDPTPTDDPTVGRTEPVTVGGDEPDENLTVDAGVVTPEKTCTVGDRVWLDTDGDGIQDDGEPGVEGVTVTLIDPETGKPVEGVEMVKTGKDGSYTLTYECGEYQVRFSDLPDDHEVTKPNAGDDDSVDSDPTASTADPTVVITDPIRPLPDGDPNVDLGLVPPTTCTLGDYVWYDDDADGIQDEGEDPVPGVTVELINSAGDVVATTETDGDGHYLFKGVECGTYQVKFSELPDGYVITKPTAGDRCEDSNPDPATGLTGEVKLGKDDPKDLCLDAGLYSPSGELPETGSSALLGWGLGGGIALAAIGGLLLIARRRNGLPG